MTPGSRGRPLAPAWTWVAVVFVPVPMLFVLLWTDGRPPARTGIAPGLESAAPPAGLSQDEWGQIRRAIRESEYHAAPQVTPGQAKSFVAGNPTQGYRASFKREGVEIVPSARAAGAWRLGVTVTGFGYQGDVRPLARADPRAEKERVEYRRGPVTEWYLNKPEGLEQGFTIAEPETRRREPIVLAMALDGTLAVRVEDPRAASFRDGGGQSRLRYADLAAWDADGRSLASRLDVSEGGLRLVVEAAEARFPVTVDPIFTQEAKLEGERDAVGSAGAQAGRSVSVSGDTAVIGAPLEEIGGAMNMGAAYVFVRSGTVWTQQQRLVAADAPYGGQFGLSVSVSGDTVIVGAPEDSTGAGSYAGSAYVFVRSGGTWNQEQKLVAADPAGFDEFGGSVSAWGDTLVVGARGKAAGAGAAYVFVRSATVWTQQQKVLASNAALGDFFGTSLSLSDDTLVVGAPGVGGPGPGENTGAGYVFVRSGTVWSEEQVLVSSDAMPSDYFGSSVSVSGDTVAVGALGHNSYRGSVYVFVRSGTVWTEQQRLEASDVAPGDEFGNSVSVSGDTLVAGSPDHSPAGELFAGSAYAFVRSGTVWSEQQELVASGGADHDFLGGAVSLSGDTAVLGAFLVDTGSGVDGAGAAYAFVRSGTAWSEEQRLTALDDAAYDEFGSSVSVSGDTAVVGAPLDHTGAGVRAGSAYVFVRSGAAWILQQKLVASDATPYAFFGESVSLSGDTLVVGSLGGPPSDPGSAYVFARTGTAWSEVQKLLASDGEAGDGFGASVFVFDDTLVVGASNDGNANGFRSGSAYLFLRTGTTWSELQKLVASDGASDDYFGSSVSMSGDTLLVGAPYHDTPAGENAGSAYAFVRSGTAWSEEQELLAPDGAANVRFGSSVSASGDTALVGALLDSTSAGAFAGSAYVFVRTGTAWSEEQKLVASDAAANDYFGASVSLSGSMAVVGASAHDTAGGADTGSVYVFLRSGTLWSEEQELAASDGAPGDAFVVVAIATGTVVVGAPGADTAAGSNAGAAYVFRMLPTDLSVSKTDGQTSAAPGASVTYTIVAANAGPGDVAGAGVTDVLPAALTGAAWTCTASPGSSCGSGGSGGIADATNLLVGGTATYTLTGIIDPAATGTLDNTVSIAVPPGGTDPDPANSATDSDVLTPQADLEVLTSDLPDPAGAGGFLTYRITATNRGPSSSSGMTMTDTLAPEVAFVVSAPGAPACTEASGTVTCNLPGLSPGASQTVTIQTTVSSGALGTIIDNTATVAGLEPDPVSGNDTDVEPTAVGPRAEGELLQGDSLWADLESVAGAPDEDLYRIGQAPFSSYEVMVDGTSGDIGTGQGPELDRVSSDGTVLQSSMAAGAGASRSLRWENGSAVGVADEYVRVRSAGCTTSCGPEDVYRIRSWETTLLVPRFNNSGLQVTVLVLQNTTDRPVSGHARFWDTAGALAGTQALNMGPRGTFVVNTTTVPGAGGVGGTITLSHDAPYGALMGKAVAVEPSTGFTFDTAVEPRKR